MRAATSELTPTTSGLCQVYTQINSLDIYSQVLASDAARSECRGVVTAKRYEQNTSSIRYNTTIPILIDEETEAQKWDLLGQGHTIRN